MCGKCKRMIKAVKLGGLVFGLLGVMGCGSREYEIIVPEETVVVTYGEDIPLDGFEIVELRNGKCEDIDADKGKFGDYDENLIGTHEVTFSYKDEKKTFTLLIKPKALNDFQIFYRDNQIQWSKVDHAGKYQVYINGVESETQDNFYSLEGYQFPAAEFTVKVKAIGEDVRYTASESNELVLKKLSTPSGIVYSEGKIRWNAVEGTQKYGVWLNGVYQETVTNEVEFDIADGENKVSITAMSSDENVVWSDDVEILLQKLQPVSNIRYSKGRISWDTEESDCDFLLLIDGRECLAVDPFYDYELEIGKIYSISVQAVSTGNKGDLGSEFVTKNIQYRRLDKPVPVVKQGTSEIDYTVEFIPVENATKYDVQVISYVGAKKTTETYTITEPKKAFTIDNQVTELVVEVTAIDGTGVYADSEIASVKKEVAHSKLAAPAVSISLGDYKNSYVVEYSKVENADTYKIEIVCFTESDSYSKEFSVSGTSKEFDVSDDVIRIEVRVTAVNESGVHDNSDITVVKKEVK